MSRENVRNSDLVRGGVMRAGPLLAAGGAIVCYVLARRQARKRPWAWSFAGMTNPLLVPAWLLITGRKKGSGAEV